jgi:hypothetical protein
MVRQTLSQLWNQCARLWQWWGWVESHVSRILLIVGAVGLLVTGGAIVMARAQQVPPLTLYLVAVFVPLGLGTLGIWSAVGLRAWLASPAVIRAPIPPEPKVARVQAARLHITPIHSETSATFRVENFGAPVSVAFVMVRIGTATGGGLPYRMRWKTVPPKGMPHGFDLFNEPSELERGQVDLGVGDIRTVQVAYLRPSTTKAKPAILAFPWPGGVETQHPVEETSLELEIDVEASPKLSQPWRRIFIMGFNERHDEIRSFEEAGPEKPTGG